MPEEESSSAFCPGELCFTAQCLGLESIGVYPGKSSFSSGTLGGRKWKKKKKQQQQQQNKVTSLRPFKLLTECPVKNPIKECSRLVDLKLNSDMRVLDRAEFDHQVAEKLIMIEQYKTEEERQQK